MGNNRIQVNNDNYISIQGFMVNELNLKGNELIIYACIYGFSQTANQEYKSGLQYLADWTNSTKKSVMNCLKSLESKGLIAKTENYINGVKVCSYCVTKFNSMEKSSMVENKVHPNNINNNMYLKEKENKEKESTFSCERETSVEETNLDTPTQAESAGPSPSRNENQLASSLIADNANPVDGTTAKKANQVGDDEIAEYFESTYTLYPRHESKIQGKKTYTKKLKGLSKEQAHSKAVYIYRCLEKQERCWYLEQRDKKYIPLISSWLNANFEDGKEK